MKFKNRYGDTVEFIKIKKNTYEFSVKDESGNPTQYWRYGWDDDGIITMVDPSGGPYISIGTDINNLIPEHTDKELHDYIFNEIPLPKNKKKKKTPLIVEEIINENGKYILKTKN